MVDPVLRRLSSLKPTSVAILGSQSVLSLGPFSPYANLLTRFRVEIPQDVEAVHALVQRIKERGATQDTILDFERIAASLESPVVVLACTEFSMLPTVSHTRAFIDPAQLLAVELVSRAENAVRNSERR
jgi:aspartate/glutamate racemase